MMDIQQDNMEMFDTGNPNHSTPLSKSLYHSPETSGTDKIPGLFSPLGLKVEHPLPTGS